MSNLTQAFLNLANKLPKDDDISKRLARAYNIVEREGYEIKYCGSGVYEVERLSTNLLRDNGATYVVTKKDCECPDFEKARAGLCKHRLAVMLISEMQALGLTEDIEHDSMCQCPECIPDPFEGI